MQIIRIYADESGESHFAELAFPLHDHGEIGRLSERIAATGVIIRETPPTYDFDWHNAPQRQIVVLLTGSIEIEASDGAKRQMHAGDLLFAEDTTGRGHRTRTLGGVTRTSLFITLD